ncbi:MAG: arsenate reductase (glutaredoxin) [Saprospiraceae bacterium]|nr:arsenate reductase (glutaredoxin) [Saprospiraceae bacterium]
METIIYHNARCSKSRECLNILESKRDDVVIRNYLKEPPDYAEIEGLLKMLKLSPLEVIRHNENIFKENYAGKNLTDREWIEAIVENPILLERPIVVKDGKAVIGRPPSRVVEIL